MWKKFFLFALTKNILKNNDGAAKISSLGILKIQSERSSQLDNDKVIQKFSAAAECRGRRLLLEWSEYYYINLLYILN